MTDEELVESVYESKGLPIPTIPMAKVTKTHTTVKGSTMAKDYENDLSILTGKKVVNVKDNIQMTIVNGKLTAINFVNFELVDEDSYVKADSFFASVDAKSEQILCQIFMYIDPVSGEVIDNKMTGWMNGSEGVNIDIFPEEMVEIISKSINVNKNIAKEFEKDSIKRFSCVVDIPVFDKSVENLKKANDELMSELKKHKSMSGSANIEEFLERYFFRKHILVQGEKGGGKTYSVDKKIRDEKIDSELVIGHEGIESIDLLGYYVKTDTGDLVWLDGALTKAFRKAIKGQVCLFIDEMLRIPKRELNILVGSLTPSSAGTYRLRTNRVINIEHGIGETEVIEIPMANLWCVGTTNVGAGYEVDEIDEALSDRFRVVNKTTSGAELEAILHSYIHGKLDASIIPKLVEFYTQMRDLMVSGEIEKIVNTRHLCEAMALSEENNEVKLYLMDLIPTWTSMDTNGQPNKAERDIITKLIKKLIK